MILIEGGLGMIFVCSYLMFFTLPEAGFPGELCLVELGHFMPLHVTLCLSLWGLWGERVGLDMATCP